MEPLPKPGPEPEPGTGAVSLADTVSNERGPSWSSTATVTANSDVEGKVTYWWTTERGESSSGQFAPGADGSCTFATVRFYNRDSSVTYTVIAVARSYTSGPIVTLEREQGRGARSYAQGRPTGRPHTHGVSTGSTARACIDDCSLSPRVMWQSRTAAVAAPAVGSAYEKYA